MTTGWRSPCLCGSRSSTGEPGPARRGRPGSRKASRSGPGPATDVSWRTDVWNPPATASASCPGRISMSFLRTGVVSSRVRRSCSRRRRTPPGSRCPARPRGDPTVARSIWGPGWRPPEWPSTWENEVPAPECGQDRGQWKKRGTVPSALSRLSGPRPGMPGLHLGPGGLSLAPGRPRRFTRDRSAGSSGTGTAGVRRGSPCGTAAPHGWWLPLVLGALVLSPSRGLGQLPLGRVASFPVVLAARFEYSMALPPFLCWMTVLVMPGEPARTRSCFGLDGVSCPRFLLSERRRFLEALPGIVPRVARVMGRGRRVAFFQTGRDP